MNNGKFLRTRHLAPLALAAALLGSGAAHADTVFSDSHLIQGTGVISSVGYQFNVSGPGVLTVDLQDQTWPSSLADLTFSLVTAGSTIGQFNGADLQTFNITQGETLYAYVTGEATNPASGLDYGIGLYSLNVSFSPVPLPPGVALLLAGLLAFGVLQLRSRAASRFPGAFPQGV